MYNDIIKRAIDNYRSKHPELINEIQRRSYDKYKTDEGYKKKNALKSQLYRDKLKQKKITDDILCKNNEIQITLKTI